MSENSGIQVPAEPSFDNEAFRGSMQQLLQDNVGNYVTITFLIGTVTQVNRSGLLYAVGTSYVVLYDDANQQYDVGDLYAIKFVTFYLPGHRPVPQSVYIQIIMRLGYTHLLKKHITHIRIKMLPRMYNNFLHPFSYRQYPADHRSLHKLRTRPDNRYYFHCSTIFNKLLS